MLKASNSQFNRGNTNNSHAYLPVGKRRLLKHCQMGLRSSRVFQELTRYRFVAAGTTDNLTTPHTECLQLPAGGNGLLPTLAGESSQGTFSSLTIDYYADYSGGSTNDFPSTAGAQNASSGSDSRLYTRRAETFF
jgi:hypothetical protein